MSVLCQRYDELGYYAYRMSWAGVIKYIENKSRDSFVSPCNINKTMK